MNVNEMWSGVMFILLYPFSLSEYIIFILCLGNKVTYMYICMCVYITCIFACGCARVCTPRVHLIADHSSTAVKGCCGRCRLICNKDTVLWSMIKDSLCVCVCVHQTKSAI